MNDVMIDIETLSTKPNASIITVGALKFNRKDEIKPLEQMDKFYMRIDLESCKILNMDIDENTIKWWKQQSEEAQYESLYHKERVSISKALIALKLWIGNSKIIWSHGKDFDCVILAEAFNKCEIKVPWEFWNTRDTRTLFDLAKIKMTDLPIDNKHHALHDCYRQYIGVKNAFKKLNCV